MTQADPSPLQVQLQPVPLERLHFWIVLASCLLFAFGTTAGYRIGAQLNIVLVFLSLWQLRRQQREWPQKIVAGIFVGGAIFILLNLFATGNIAADRSLPRVMYATFLAVALTLLPVTLPASFRKQVVDRAVWVAGAYVLAQLAALFLLGQFPGCSPCSGTTSNPHYLALFTLLALPVLIHRAWVLRGMLRAGMCVLIVAAFFLLLQTSSRPAWLAVLAAALIGTVFLKGPARFWGLAAAIALPWLLYRAGPARFTARVDDLIINIAKEERVAIWSDGWLMQLGETDLDTLLWGHGLDSYFAAFKAYSTFHGIRDFAFPHNFILEILYLSGVFGLAAAVIIYLVLIKRFWLSILATAAETPPVAAIAVLATFIATGVHGFLVFPFFSHYNLVIIALATGVFAYQVRTKGDAR